MGDRYEEYRVSHDYEQFGDEDFFDFDNADGPTWLQQWMPYIYGGCLGAALFTLCCCGVLVAVLT